jgi:serine/threonine protein phosphatase PrpC
VTVQGGTGDSGASVQALPWHVHAASAIGAGHLRDGRPNEDAIAHELTLPTDGSALLVVGVADGHGDARHFRSDRGAKMAVAAGISATRDWAANISGSPARIKLSAQRELVPGIVARWDAAVAADLADDQLTMPEHALLADLALSPQTAYGSTLLVGAFTGGYAVFTQIGDGNIVAV